MPIKKSSLEQKRSYRAAKSFVLVLPIVVAVLLLLDRSAPVCVVVQQDLLSALAYIAIGVALYYVVLKVVWRTFLYIVFGGLEDDAKKPDGDKPTPTPTPSRRMGAEQVIPLVIVLATLVTGALILTGYITLPKLSDDTNVVPTQGPRCPATSAQTSTPCRSSQGGVGVSGVIVRDSCKCPSDTTYSGTTDVVTPGGPYKICTCN